MGKVVPRGLEPRTLRLLAVRSNQLSYETFVRSFAAKLLYAYNEMSIGRPCTDSGSFFCVLSSPAFAVGSGAVLGAHGARA